jgi:hypothetical protein
LGSLLQAPASWRADFVPGWVSNHDILYSTVADEYRGGIRGIVILQVLERIEKEFDHRIPIQDFFDLIVGTR